MQQRDRDNKNIEYLSKLPRGNNNSAVVLVTGDLHGDFRRVRAFCDKYQTTVDDILIILGDAGINYYRDYRDLFLKEALSQLPITMFCIRGNHEQRPENINYYKETLWHGGKVFIEENFQNIIFAKDGEIYDIMGKKSIVIGGAYSVDKWYRLENNYIWFEDEQLSFEEKKHIEERLEQNNWKIDVVLSHTLPYQYRPTDMFIKSEEDLRVDESMELWLKEVESKLTYEKWYGAHYHCDRKMDKLQIMYRNVEIFCNDTDLKFSME